MKHNRKLRCWRIIFLMKSPNSIGFLWMTPSFPLCLSLPAPLQARGNKICSMYMCDCDVLRQRWSRRRRTILPTRCHFLRGLAGSARLLFLIRTINMVVYDAQSLAFLLVFLSPTLEAPPPSFSFHVSRETLDCEVNLFEQITITTGEVLPSFYPSSIICASVTVNYMLRLCLDAALPLTVNVTLFGWLVLI